MQERAPLSLVQILNSVGVDVHLIELRERKLIRG